MNARCLLVSTISNGLTMLMCPEPSLANIRPSLQAQFKLQCTHQIHWPPWMLPLTTGLALTPTAMYSASMQNKAPLSKLPALQYAAGIAVFAHMWSCCRILLLVLKGMSANLPANHV
eukprot:GHRR01032924.1.p2 GENE.GHRR01032924.1~~GHRR01032924.1.p2  ORF type:complete len:117 (-),score=20.39 GHRR01032924.1:890-1240(-)